MKPRTPCNCSGEHSGITYKKGDLQGKCSRDPGRREGAVLPDLTSLHVLSFLLAQLLLLFYFKIPIEILNSCPILMPIWESASWPSCRRAHVSPADTRPGSPPGPLGGNGAEPALCRAAEGGEGKALGPHGTLFQSWCGHFLTA